MLREAAGSFDFVLVGLLDSLIKEPIPAAGFEVACLFAGDMYHKQWCSMTHDRAVDGRRFLTA
jgi:hypothetical protein